MRHVDRRAERRRDFHPPIPLVRQGPSIDFREEVASRPKPPQDRMSDDASGIDILKRRHDQRFPVQEYHRVSTRLPHRPRLEYRVGNDSTITVERARDRERQWPSVQKYHRRVSTRYPSFPEREDKDFDYYYDANHTRDRGDERMVLAGRKDLTVHFSLDVGVNLDQEIEALSKLSRIGDFRSAKRYFEDNLQEYIDSPHVFLRYAQMLLDMGDYGGMSSLEPFFDNMEKNLNSDGRYWIELRVWQSMKACYQARNGQANFLTEVRNGVDGRRILLVILRNLIYGLLK